MADQEAQGTTDRTQPNTNFLSKYIKGLDSGNKRAIARNAARGAQQAVGASGAAALRPTLHKAAGKGVESVRRAVLMSADQSKHTLCVALLREVAQVFGYSLSITMDGEEVDEAEQQQELQPLPLSPLKVRLSSGPAAAAIQQRHALAAGAGRGLIASHHRLQLAAFRSIGLPSSRANSAVAAARMRALQRPGNAARQQQDAAKKRDDQQQEGSDDDRQQQHDEANDTDDNVDGDHAAAAATTPSGAAEQESSGYEEVEQDDGSTGQQQQQQQNVQCSRDALDVAAAESTPQSRQQAAAVTPLHSLQQNADMTNALPTAQKSSIFSRLGASPAAAAVAAAAPEGSPASPKHPRSSSRRKVQLSAGATAIAAAAAAAAVATAGASTGKTPQPARSAAEAGLRTPANATAATPAIVKAHSADKTTNRVQLESPIAGAAAAAAGTGCSSSKHQRIPIPPAATGSAGQCSSHATPAAAAGAATTGGSSSRHQRIPIPPAATGLSIKKQISTAAAAAIEDDDNDEADAAKVPSARKVLPTADAPPAAAAAAAAAVHKRPQKRSAAVLAAAAAAGDRANTLNSSAAQGKTTTAAAAGVGATGERRRLSTAAAAAAMTGGAEPVHKKQRRNQQQEQLQERPQPQQQQQSQERRRQLQQQQQQQGRRSASGWEDHRGLAADDEGWEEVMQDGDEDYVMDYALEEDGTGAQQGDGYDAQASDKVQQQQRRVRSSDTPQHYTAAAVGCTESSSGKGRVRIAVATTVAKDGRCITATAKQGGAGNLTISSSHGEQQQQRGVHGRVSVLQRLGKSN